MDDCKKIRVWCELCEKDVFIRAKSVNDIFNEAMFHKCGYCIRKKDERIIINIPYLSMDKRLGKSHFSNKIYKKLRPFEEYFCECKEVIPRGYGYTMGNKVKCLSCGRVNQRIQSSQSIKSANNLEGSDESK